MSVFNVFLVSLLEALFGEFRSKRSPKGGPLGAFWETFGEKGENVKTAFPLAREHNSEGPRGCRFREFADSFATSFPSAVLRRFFGDFCDFGVQVGSGLGSIWALFRSFLPSIFRSAKTGQKKGVGFQGAGGSGGQAGGGIPFRRSLERIFLEGGFSTPSGRPTA